MDDRTFNRITHVCLLIFNVVMATHGAEDGRYFLTGVCALGALLGAILIGFAPESFWSDETRCRQRGCTQIDGKPCAYADCPNRSDAEAA